MTTVTEEEIPLKVRKAMRPLLHELTEHDDLEVVRLGGLVIEALRNEATAAVAAARRRAIRNLRHDHTTEEIARLTGMSRARVQQISDV